MDKKLFIDPDRTSALLTFDNMAVLLNGHPTEVDLKVNESKGTVSGSMEVAAIPFKIHRGQIQNAMIFLGEDDMWVIPEEEQVFVMKVGLKSDTSKLDFTTMLFEGEVYFENIPFQGTEFHSSTAKAIAAEQALEKAAEEKAKEDMLQQKLEFPEVSIKKMEIDLLLGAVEDLASISGWVPKNTPLPISDKALHAICKENANDIVNYFETKLEQNGVKCYAEIIEFLSSDADLVVDVTQKEIKKVKNTLPKALKRIVTLRQVKSGAVLGIRLSGEENKIVLFALQDMPPVVFGSVKEARHTFKALKLHPDFKKYFIEGADVIPVDELDSVSLHQKAVLVKSSLHLLQWIGADYGTGM